MPDEHVRLFVALELPGAVRESLIGWRDQALGRAPGLRPLGVDALHVTLCFLGWQDVGEVDAIAAACGELAGTPAPRLSLGEARWLPAPRRPRVLAVELLDPAAILVGAQARLSQALAAGGWYQPEKRPYLAHVTVARAARGATASRDPLARPSALAFDATELTLFRSRLSRRGARYEPLTRIELQ